MNITKNGLMAKVYKDLKINSEKDKQSHSKKQAKDMNSQLPKKKPQWQV